MIIPSRHNAEMPPKPSAKTKTLPNDRLKALRESKGWSQAHLADLVGCGQGDIAKLETGNKRTTVDWMVRLAKPLGVDPKDLMPTALGDVPLLTLPGGEAAVGPRPRVPLDGDMIPVRSAARGGDQEMFLHDGPIDWTKRPPILQNVRDPYALYVVGESMMPRFRPGQLLYVNPHKPPMPGYGVVVTKKNDAVTVKEFNRRTNRALFVAQYNPAKTFEIELDEVRDIHLVVGIDEP